MCDRVEPFPVPETGTREILEGLATGAAGLVPVFGPIASALVAQLFSQQASARQQVWLDQLTDVVNAIIGQVADLEAADLLSQPDFHDAVARTAQIALSTSLDEKHRALKNALFHVGTESARDLDRDQRAVFLTLVETLTPSHVDLLKFLRSPEAALPEADAKTVREGWDEGSVWELVRGFRPQWTDERRTQFRFLITDLEAKQLLKPVNLDSSVRGRYLFESLTTEFGSQFLDFIEGPFTSTENPSTPHPFVKPGSAG